MRGKRRGNGEEGMEEGGEEKGSECGEKENGSGRTEENMIRMIPNSSSARIGARIGR